MLRIRVFLIAFLTASFSYADEKAISFPQLDGFNLKTDFPVYNPDNLWEYINGGAYTYVNYQFVDLHIAEYSNDKLIIKAEIYHHKNNVYTYGMYTQERAPDYSFVDIGIQGYAENTLVNFVKGPYYVKIICNDGDDSTKPVLLKLAKEIEQNLQGTTSVPEMFNKFPQEGRVPNSDSYISTEFLGYEFMPGAYIMPYDLNGKKFKLFIVDCDTAEKCNEVWKKLELKAKSIKRHKKKIFTFS
ncbi:MAG: hypothetical protein GXO47_10775, partial [Chlorobi bacterium]|nr:hypothetical protein [Chlorobiota bacterium]